MLADSGGKAWPCRDRGDTVERQTPHGQQSAGRTLSGSDVTPFTGCRALPANCAHLHNSPQASLLHWALAHLPSKLPPGQCHPHSSTRSAAVHGIPVTCRRCVTCSGLSGERDTRLGGHTAWPGSWPGKRAAPVPGASPGLRKARSRIAEMVFFSRP